MEIASWPVNDCASAHGSDASIKKTHQVMDSRANVWPSAQHSLKISRVHKTKLTFINKNIAGGSISRSTPQERKQINESSRAHRRITKKANASAGESSGTESSTDREEESRPLRSTRTALAVAHGTIEYSSPRAHPLPRPLGNATEPFNSVSVEMNTGILDMLRFYKDHLNQDIWAWTFSILEDTVNQHAISRCTPEKVIIESLEDSTRLRCMLAWIACRMERDGVASAGNQHLFYLNHGVTALRKDLLRSSTMDEDALCSALYLYYASCLAENDRAQHAHRVGVRAIVGALQAQRKPIRSSLAALTSICDFELACQLLSRMPNVWARAETAPVAQKLVEDEDRL